MQGLKKYLRYRFRKYRNVPPHDQWLKTICVSDWPDYQAWLFRYYYLSSVQWKEQRRVARKANNRIYFSVVAPVYNVNPFFLEECFKSVYRQSYPFWELVLVDDGSSSRETREKLQELSKIDQRVKVICQEENRGICFTTNHALNCASGDFIVFVDNDDILAPQALFEVVKAIRKNPGVGLLYSDHDMISPEGRLYMHLLKPSWGEETVLNTNYTCHLSVYERSLLNKIGGLDEKSEGAQDQDLILRARECGGDVRHIPLVLYHWRQHEQSVTLQPDVKGYLYQAQKDLLARAMQRRGCNAEIEELPHLWRGNCRVKLERFADSEVWVELVKSSDYENSGKKFFSRVLSRTSAHNSIVFLRDCLSCPDNDGVSELVSWFRLNGVGMSTGKIVDKQGRIVHAGMIFRPDGTLMPLYNGFAEEETPGYMAYTSTIRNVSLACPDCFAVRREILEKFLKLLPTETNLAETVFCLSILLLQNDIRLVFTPFARFVCTSEESKQMSRHWHSIGKEQISDYKEFVEKGDPHYSPNLSLAHNDMRLGFHRFPFQEA